MMRSYIDIINKLLENDAIDHGELLWKQFCRAANWRPTDQEIKLLSIIGTFYQGNRDLTWYSQDLYFPDTGWISKFNINYGVYHVYVDFTFGSNFAILQGEDDAVWNKKILEFNDSMGPAVSQVLHRQFGINVEINDFVMYDEPEYSVGGYYRVISDQLSSIFKPITLRLSSPKVLDLDLEENWPQIQDYLTRTYT